MAKKHRYSNELIATDKDASQEEQVSEILAKASGSNYEWLLITQEYFDPCEGRGYSAREFLVVDLGSALTCSCDIVAIYNRNRALSSEELLQFQNEAISMLGPISKAKAEGRFPR